MRRLLIYVIENKTENETLIKSLYNYQQDSTALGNFKKDI